MNVVIGYKLMLRLQSSQQRAEEDIRSPFIVEFGQDGDMWSWSFEKM